MGLLLSGCFSTIKPAKQIDDNQKVIAKEEKKVDSTLVEIEKNDKGKKGPPKELLEKYDTNKDGKLDQEERSKVSKEDKKKFAPRRRGPSGPPSPRPARHNSKG